jgi:hypothetical protein
MKIARKVFIVALALWLVISSVSVIASMPQVVHLCAQGIELAHRSLPGQKAILVGFAIAIGGAFVLGFEIRDEKDRGWLAAVAVLAMVVGCGLALSHEHTSPDSPLQPIGIGDARALPAPPAKKVAGTDGHGASLKGAAQDKGTASTAPAETPAATKPEEVPPTVSTPPARSSCACVPTPTTYTPPPAPESSARKKEEPWEGEGESFEEWEAEASGVEEAAREAEEPWAEDEWEGEEEWEGGSEEEGGW